MTDSSFATPKRLRVGGLLPFLHRHPHRECGDEREQVERQGGRESRRKPVNDEKQDAEDIEVNEGLLNSHRPLMHMARLIDPRGDDNDKSKIGEHRNYKLRN